MACGCSAVDPGRDGRIVLSMWFTCSESEYAREPHHNSPRGAPDRTLAAAGHQQAQKAPGGILGGWFG